MNRPFSDRSYADALQRRSVELTAKADKAETPEARTAFQDLAKLYADMAAAIQELERLRSASR